MRKNILFIAIFSIMFAFSAHSQVPNIEMVHVQGGQFLMGCTEKKADCSVNEAPAHPVILKSYYIAKYEVTQELWMAVMGGKNPSKVIGDSLPITGVSWYDAQTFIGKLNQLTGKKYRLPTEAEWEFAARGGNLSHHYKFSGSNTLEDVAWCNNNSGNKPHVVGTKQPNELGIYDMSGNVYEWCSDGFDLYEWNSSVPLENPTGYNLSETKVYRGGGMTSYWDVCRVSARAQGLPNAQFNHVGFRLALDEESK